MATPVNPTSAEVRVTASRWKRGAKFAVLVALLVGALGTLMELNRERIERNAQAWLGRSIDSGAPSRVIRQRPAQRQDPRQLA